MVILVTGCAGFIGYNLCDRLLTEGHKVVGIDNLNDDYDISLKEKRISNLKSFRDFDFVKLDILNDGLWAVLKHEKIKYIVHLASKDNYYNFSEAINYSSFLDTNVTGTSKILELAHLFNVKKFVYASTYSVYGKTKSTVLNERVGVLKPISPHGASKLAAEQVVHFVHNYYGIPSVVLRISSVYGPGMRPFTLIPKIIDRLHKNKTVEVFDNGMQRDYIFIDDVVEYIIRSLKVRVKHQVLNISSGKSISIEDLGTMVGEIMGLKKNVEFVKEGKYFNRVFIKSIRINNERAKRILKYSPRVDLDQGLPLTISWYLNNEDVLGKSVTPI